MLIGRRLATRVAAGACVAVLVSVFFPWVTRGGTNLAGWGSEAHPQLRGMLVITCAAVALSLLIASSATVGVRRRVLAETAAAVLLAGLIVVSSVISDPGSYAGAPASSSAGAWFALLALLLAILTALAGALGRDR